jgi:hypothetical protein
VRPLAHRLRGVRNRPVKNGPYQPHLMAPP